MEKCDAAFGRCRGNKKKKAPETILRKKPPKQFSGGGRACVAGVGLTFLLMCVSEQEPGAVEGVAARSIVVV